MPILRVIVIILLLMIGAGCRSTSADERYKAWELEMFKNQAACHQQVILVCVYESHFQRRTEGYHHLDCKGTVVRSYKGTWRVGEQIALHHDLEAVPEGWTPSAGYLEFYLLDQHASEPIDVDVAEDWDYKPEFDRALQSIYSRQALK